MGWLVFFLIVGAVVWATASAIGQAKLQKAEDNTFASTYRGWDFFVSPHNRNVLAINREQGQVALGSVSAPKQYSLSTITQVEVLRDGASITSTNRGSQLAGAAIGALALGGIGLLLGGLTGSKRNQNTIHSIAIKIVVDDSTSPVHTIEFFKSPDKKGTDSKDSFVTAAAEKVDHFHALLVNALKNTATPAEDSVALQLGRLWELKQAGALTDDEFAAQKQRLLGAQTIARHEQT